MDDRARSEGELLEADDANATDAGVERTAERHAGVPDSATGDRDALPHGDAPRLRDMRRARERPPG